MKTTTKSRRDNLRLSKRVNHTEYYYYRWLYNSTIYIGWDITRLEWMNDRWFFKPISTVINGVSKRVEVEND